jgi:hypothetical protein
MARGKCPKCDEVVTRASVETVDIVRSGGGAEFVGASSSAPIAIQYSA